MGIVYIPISLIAIKFGFPNILLYIYIRNYMTNTMETVISTFRALQDVEYMIEITSSMKDQSSYVKVLKREKERLQNHLTKLVKAK